MSIETTDARSDLASRFSAALISYRLGIGMDYALKRYVKNAGNDEYWLQLADQVERDVVESLCRKLAPGPR